MNVRKMFECVKFIECIHPVGGIGRPRYQSPDEEIDILAYFRNHPHNSVCTAASEINVPCTAV